MTQIALPVISAGIIAWQFSVVRSNVRSVSHDIESGVSSVTGRTALEIGQKTRQQLLRGNLERALEEYEAVRGRRPRDLHDLVREGLIDKSDLVDEWGRALAVESGESGILVRSAGPDGRLYTQDDWVVGG